MQKKSGPTSLNALLQSQPSTLQRIFKTATAMSEMQATLKKALPENLQDAVIIRFYRAGVLAVNVPSGMYATLLRIQEQSIADKLKCNRTFEKLARLEIKIRLQAPQKKSHNKPMRMSEENSRLLKKVAGETEDVNLQRTLERLATRAHNTCDD